MRWIEAGDPAAVERKMELARRAVERDPGNLRCWRALFTSLRQAGEFDELKRCVDAALVRFPHEVELQLESVRALIDTGRFEAAYEKVERVIADDGDCAAARRLRYRLLMLLRRPDEAAALGGAPADDAPLFAEAAARACFGSGRFAELVALCDAHLARQCGHTGATYWKAMALAGAGRNAEARAVVSLERYVAVTVLTAPPGYADAAAFRADLAREIARNPTLVPDPRGKATHGGLQTRRLRRGGAAATELLLALLKDAVDAYVRRLPRAADGFVRACPQAARLSAWAVVTGAGGHQTSHFHNGGWLSGVYYVEAPRGESGFFGPLVLGGLDKGALAGVQQPVAVHVVFGAAAAALHCDHHHVEVGRADAGGVEAIGDGERRCGGVDALALDAGEPLFLDGGDDAVAIYETYGAVMRRADAQHPWLFADPHVHSGPRHVRRGVSRARRA